MGLENWVGAACSSACGKRIDSPYPQITHQQPYIYTEPGFAPPEEMCHLNRSKESGALMNCLEVGLGSDLSVRSWPQPLLDPGPPTGLILAHPQHCPPSPHPGMLLPISPPHPSQTPAVARLCWQELRRVLRCPCRSLEARFSLLLVV